MGKVECQMSFDLEDVSRCGETRYIRVNALSARPEYNNIVCTRIDDVLSGKGLLEEHRVFGGVRIFSGCEVSFYQLLHVNWAIYPKTSAVANKLFVTRPFKFQLETRPRHTFRKACDLETRKRWRLPRRCGKLNRSHGDLADLLRFPLINTCPCRFAVLEKEIVLPSTEVWLGMLVTNSLRI